ncbi:hypothetical protein PSH58_04270 [Pseudomonas hefeiensis]|nr:hypothetical protein [Pseudomonas sp. FP53]WLH96639.1 hypothetical protein PSH58_04270 [Pseudomonas sp. FP53]
MAFIEARVSEVLLSSVSASALAVTENRLSMRGSVLGSGFFGLR